MKINKNGPSPFCVSGSHENLKFYSQLEATKWYGLVPSFAGKVPVGQRGKLNFYLIQQSSTNQNFMFAEELWGTGQ